MYNNNSYGNGTPSAPTPGQDPSPSSTQRSTATNDLSSCPVFQLNGVQYDISQLNPQLLLAPLIQSALQQQMPPPARNSGHIYCDGGSHAHAPNNAAGSSQGDIHTPAPYSQPTLPNVHRGQAGENPSFVGQPPTMANCLANMEQSHPEVFARVNAQGVPNPLWELHDARLGYEGDNSDFIRVVIVFKKIRY